MPEPALPMSIDPPPADAVDVQANPVTPVLESKPVVIRRRRSLTIPLLLLLTLIAGGLRFLALDRPTIWGDEAMTYGRSAGTYQDLLEQLYSASFPPLHYEMLWWMKEGMPYWGKLAPREPVSQDAANKDEPLMTWVPTQRLVPGGIRLTPFFMRLIPAIAGTLFIPAMYFLARQLFGRRVSLLTAFLSCFSAYLLVYSRDAKMYMPFWLFCALNVGCLLWWLRDRRPLPWLLWVASGVAMLGWHASGFTILAIDALIFFTSPKLNWRKVPALAGLIIWTFTILYLVPIAIAVMYAVEKVRGKPHQFGQSVMHQCWAWRRRTVRNFKWPAIVFFALGLAVIVSTMFGPLGFYSSFNAIFHHVADDSQPLLDIRAIEIGWVGDYNRGRSLDGHLLYTTSAYLTGWEWPRSSPFAGLNDQAKVDPRTLKLLQSSTVALLALLAIGIVPWRRIFKPSRARLDRIQQDGRVYPPFVRRRVIWLWAWIVLIGYGAYVESTPTPALLPDLAATIALKKPPYVVWPRLQLNADDKILDQFGVHGTAWQAFMSGAAKSWQAFTAAFTRDNLAIGQLTALGIFFLLIAAACIWRWRTMTRTTLRLTLAVGTMAIACLIIGLLPRFANNSVWMPRYVAVMLPAVLMAVAVLIARQPTRWLPVVTMSVFVIVNLSQFSARVFGHSEPPTPRMAADLIAAQPHDLIPANPAVQTFRAYTDFGPVPMAEPGGTALFNGGGRYYLHLLSGWKDHGREVRQGDFEDNLNTWRFSAPATIERDLKRSPQITSFVVWTSLPAGEVDQTDPVADKLAGQFRRVSDEVWPVADHWRWVQHPQVRRREYVRLANPTTQPQK